MQVMPLPNFAEAVHRYFESRRRVYNDEKPNRLEIVEKQKKEIKEKNRQRQVGDMFLSLLQFLHVLHCSSVVPTSLSVCEARRTAFMEATQL